jgi:hypothetical protein
MNKPICKVCNRKLEDADEVIFIANGIMFYDEEINATLDFTNFSNIIEVYHKNCYKEY